MYFLWQFLGCLLNLVPIENLTFPPEATIWMRATHYSDWNRHNEISCWPWNIMPISPLYRFNLRLHLDYIDISLYRYNEIEFMSLFVLLTCKFLTHKFWPSFTLPVDWNKIRIFWLAYLKVIQLPSSKFQLTTFSES